MQTFVDNKGRAWTVSVTTLAAKRVRQVLGVDLMDVIDASKGLLEALHRDPVSIADVVYAVCQPQAERLGVSQDEFLDAIGGDAILHARDALLDGLADFFPAPPVREALRRIIALTRRQEEAATAEAARRIAGGAIEAAVDRELQRLGSSSGDAPASSESIPAP